jgi:hypothetical protein
MNRQRKASIRDLTQAATFSPCRTYRYLLRRVWSEADGTLLIIGLNPSTADEQSDDPTIRRCIAFAKRLGHGQLLMANLFGYRATDPAELLKANDPIGPENDTWIALAAEAADLTIVAWGTNGALLDRHSSVLTTLTSPHCLGKTKHGFPRHPLYLPANARLRVFENSR